MNAMESTQLTVPTSCLTRVNNNDKQIYTSNPLLLIIGLAGEQMRNKVFIAGGTLVPSSTQDK